MPVRKPGPCRSCSHWRDAGSVMLAGTPAQQGECRRRVQTGEDGLRPRPPTTQPKVGCSEHLPMPAPGRLAQCCGDCQYWWAPEVARIGAADEGRCYVWAPRWSGAGPGLSPHPARLLLRRRRQPQLCGPGRRGGLICQLRHGSFRPRWKGPWCRASRPAEPARLLAAVVEVGGQRPGQVDFDALGASHVLEVATQDAGFRLQSCQTGGRGCGDRLRDRLPLYSQLVRLAPELVLVRVAGAVLVEVVEAADDGGEKAAMRS